MHSSPLNAPKGGEPMLPAHSVRNRARLLVVNVALDTDPEQTVELV